MNDPSPDTLRDVRRAHRCLATYNLQITDILIRMIGAIESDHPTLVHVRTRPVRFGTWGHVHAPARRLWPLDLQPFATADLIWATSAVPQRGAVGLRVRHAIDTGLLDQWERPSDASEGRTTLKVDVLHVADDENQTWRARFQHNSDPVRSSTVDVAALLDPEAVQTLLIDPVRDHCAKPN